MKKKDEASHWTFIFGLYYIITGISEPTNAITHFVIRVFDQAFVKSIIELELKQNDKHKQ